jgi:hypothetical protein
MGVIMGVIGRLLLICGGILATFAPANAQTSTGLFSPPDFFQDCFDFTKFKPGFYPHVLYTSTTNGTFVVDYHTDKKLEVTSTRLNNGQLYTGAAPGKIALSFSLEDTKGKGNGVKVYISYVDLTTFGNRSVTFYDPSENPIITEQLWSSPTGTQLQFFYPTIGDSAVTIGETQMNVQNTLIGTMCVIPGAPTAPTARQLIRHIRRHH